MGMKTARAEQLPFLEALGLYHFAATGEGEPYLFARLGRLDPDAAPFRNGHYRPRRALAPTFRRLEARPATVSLRCSRAFSAATVSPGRRRCSAMSLSFSAANTNTFAAPLRPPMAVRTAILRHQVHATTAFTVPPVISILMPVLHSMGGSNTA